jgi:hypothetical protein
MEHYIRPSWTLRFKKTAGQAKFILRGAGKMYFAPYDSSSLLFHRLISEGIQSEPVLPSEHWHDLVCVASSECSITIGTWLVLQVLTECTHCLPSAIWPWALWCLFGVITAQTVTRISHLILGSFRTLTSSYVLHCKLTYIIKNFRSNAFEKLTRWMPFVTITV